MQTVHMPAVKQLLLPKHDGAPPVLGPAQETLMFAIYFAAVTSMEEPDVSMTLFDILKIFMLMLFTGSRESRVY